MEWRFLKTLWTAATTPHALKIIGGVLVALVVLGAGLWYFVFRTTVPAFPINPHDHIASWTFQGAYSGKPQFMQKGQKDIAHLKSELNKGKYSNYNLYIGIGDDEVLLGNGKAAYQAYNKAISLYPNQGLAYTDLANLMANLHARYTAADAYTKAVDVQPSVLEYHLEQLNYLTQNFATDTPKVAAAFAQSSKQYGDIAQVLAIEAQWLTARGEYAKAIAAWQRAIAISPGRNVTPMQNAIAQLKQKEQQASSTTGS